MAMAMLAGCAVGPARAQSAPGAVYLSWHQPYGEPGAADTLETRCDQPERVDTLFVSVRAAGDTPNVIGMRTALQFIPVPGDTLGAFWHFKRGWENQQNMFIEFGPNEAFPCPQPWRVIGTGAVRYDHVRSLARLDLEYIVRSEQSIPLTPEAYNCVARILIHERRSELEGCGQPLRIQATGVRLEMLNGEAPIYAAGDTGAVYWNVVDRDAWKVNAPRTQPWKPGTPGAPMTPGAGDSRKP
jgi:hypothetical protein